MLMLWLTAGGRLLLCESGGSLSAADSLERPALTIPFLKQGETASCFRQAAFQRS